MNGIERARQYYEAFGKPMLEAQFPEIMDKIAVGVCGSGSDSFGYDDTTSRDHDMDPGFCIFLPEETVVDRRTAFLLERAYHKLPKTFDGLTRPLVNPVGGARRGVLRRDDFFTAKTGIPDGSLPLEAWFRIPSYALAEATNGAVFFDGDGRFTAIREKLKTYPPDVMKKKLAASLVLMAQSGEYNFPRILKHGETAAAALALYRYADAALDAAFLLGERYRPFYKWSFRALREILAFATLASPLEKLLTEGFDRENAEQKSALIGEIDRFIVEKLREKGLSDADGTDPEQHAFAVNARIEDPALRNEHILFAAP